MATREDIPFYRLYDMIALKYGELKVDHGCNIVAQFLTGEKVSITSSQVWALARTLKHDKGLTHDHVAAFKKLFGFSRIEELFSFPEQMPEAFKTIQS